MAFPDFDMSCLTKALAKKSSQVPGGAANKKFLESALTDKFDVKAWEAFVTKALGADQRMGAVLAVAEQRAKRLGLNRDARLTKLNSSKTAKRVVYVDQSTGRLYSVDVQHGRFEMCKANGKHIEEIDFDLKGTGKTYKDTSHDLRAKSGDSMNPVIQSALATWLPEPDREAWLAACKRPVPGVDTIMEQAKALDVVHAQAYADRIAPSAQLVIDVQRWLDGAFIAEYTTKVSISRLAPVYTVEHGFSVQNRHPQALDPSLAGEDGYGFIAAQRALHEQTSEVLDALGMTELDAWTLDSPVVELLGSRWHTERCLPTVRMVLFEDFFDLLDG